MALFEKQPMKCCVCGQDFMTDFTYCGGYCCSPECRQEYEWRHTLYVTGEKYRAKRIVIIEDGK